jgi:hypothetical protein
MNHGQRAGRALLWFVGKVQRTITMDESRFDQALRNIAGVSGRREAIRSLSLAGMSLLAAFDVPSGADAKKKGRRKKKCKGGTKRCGKKCIPSANCCSSTDCGGGACVAGTCQCLIDSRSCGGKCVPKEQCCEAGDCDDGNPCTTPVCNGNGTCGHRNRPDFSYCGGNNSLCSGGECAIPPICAFSGIVCTRNSDCCSGMCTIFQGEITGYCQPVSTPGQPCRDANHCSTGKCVGFVCTR